MNIRDEIRRLQGMGYGLDDARARICQDVILKAIAESSFSRKVTIKGGVVVRSKSNNIRRATQDMDIDFIRYSLSDESIDYFLKSINVLEKVRVKRVGNIERLNQQDYEGKRVYVRVTDKYGNYVDSKLDLGVHKYLEIEQEEYCFDIGIDETGVSLLVNSIDQMIVEKLKSLLRFGVFSTRYKDVYDIFYYCGQANLYKVRQNINIYIFNDDTMKENSMTDIFERVRKVFANNRYKTKVDKSDKRWLDDSIEDIFDSILDFLEKISV